MSGWTLESELLQLSGAETVTEALEIFGITSPSDEAVRLTIDRDWYQGGAETWVFVFSVVCSTRAPQQFILKACAPSFAPRPVSEICDSWFKLRHYLTSEGISAPRVFARNGPLWLEEFIQDDLKQALRRRGTDLQLPYAIGATARGLLATGYYSRSYHDWRTNGNDVVLVDFGSDLSKVHETVEPSYILNQLHAFFDPVLPLAQQREELSRGFRDRVYDGLSVEKN